MKFITKSEEDTYNLAYKFAKSIGDRAVICLDGDLGAGKTVFVRGFSKYFGVDYISSPTFTIVNEYNGTVPIYHFDVYRLSGEEEFYDIGGEEYFENGICIIEWSNRIKDALPKNRVHISISKISENEREIIIEGM
jgi:tRNA threonylcarbamoyladenosine biosynthesis protein TsaE